MVEAITAGDGSGWCAYQYILQVCLREEDWRVWFMNYDGSRDTYLTCGYLQSMGLLGSKDAFVGPEGPSMKDVRLFEFGRHAVLKPDSTVCGAILWPETGNFIPRVLRVSSIHHRSSEDGLYAHTEGWPGGRLWPTVQGGTVDPNNVPL